MATITTKSIRSIMNSLSATEKLKSLAMSNTISPPDFKLADIKIPTKEDNNYFQSSGKLMKVLATEAQNWKNELADNYQPAIIAILQGGIQIHVNTLTQVSFHGIRIEGTLNGSPCAILAHQATIQMLCHAEEINDESPIRSIGFIWHDDQITV